MKTAYDLFQKLIEIMKDIDKALDKKSKFHNAKILQTLDSKIDVLEAEMHEIKNKLKNINIK